MRGRFHYTDHQGIVETLNRLCDSNAAFRFPKSSDLIIPLRSSVLGEPTKQERLHRTALRSILVEQCNWYRIMNSLYDSTLADAQATVLFFGLEQCIPPTVMRKMRARLVSTIEGLRKGSRLALDGHLNLAKENAIAVVGMACKVAGADDLDEFWSLLREGKSQHIEVPEDRINFGTYWRA